MPIIVDATDQITSDDTPVLVGTCDARNADIQATVRVNAVTGGPDDVFSTKAIGGQWAVATEPLVRATGVAFASSKTADANRYVSEQVLIRLNSGAILSVFRRGAEHVDNAGRIFCAKSTDEGVSYSSEVLVHDHVSGFDTRNQAGGVDPVTGRVWVFFALYDYPTQREGVYVVYSDDEGDTWSTATDLLPQFPAAQQASKAVIPFGPMLETSNGLMQIFYHHGDAWALFYNRVTDTWGSRADVWTGYTPTNSIGEPFGCRVDNDRIVLTIRDNVNFDSYRYVKSSDGGSTWGSVSDPYKYTYTTMTANGPCRPTTWRGQAVMAIVERAPGFRIHTSRLALEDFWDRPYALWHPENIYRINDHHIATTSTSIDLGYSSFLGIPAYPDTGIVMFYDQDGATSTDVSIYSSIIGVV